MRDGSMTWSHTSSIGASMSMLAIDDGHGAELPVVVRAHARPAARALPVAQRALDRAVEAVQAHAEQVGGALVARQQVAARLSMSGPMKPGSSPAIAAAIGAAIGVDVAPEPQRAAGARA